MICVERLTGADLELCDLCIMTAPGIPNWLPCQQHVRMYACIIPLF